jgi:hypothetical protein
MTNLNGGTLCNAEFGIRHRAAPYRKGQVLHSVFAAALIQVEVDEVTAFTTDLRAQGFGKTRKARKPKKAMSAKQSAKQSEVSS